METKFVLFGFVALLLFVAGLGLSVVCEPYSVEAESMWSWIDTDLNMIWRWRLAGELIMLLGTAGFLLTVFSVVTQET